MLRCACLSWARAEGGDFSIKHYWSTKSNYYFYVDLCSNILYYKDMAKRNKKEVFKDVAALLEELAWAEKNRMSQDETIAYQLYLAKRQAVLDYAHEIESTFHTKEKTKANKIKKKLTRGKIK